MPHDPPKVYPDIYPFISPKNFKDAHKGKLALITGAGGDIAQQISKHFAMAGATLAVTDITLDKLESTVALCREHGAKVVPFACNISNETEVQGLIKDVKEQLGDIDILINAAGVCTSRPILLDSFASIWREIEINLGGVLLTMLNVLPSMKARGNGCIINLASRAGTVSVPYLAGYSISKASVIKATENIQKDLDADGLGDKIQLYCCHPGAVLTRLSNRPMDPVIAGAYPHLATNRPKRLKSYRTAVNLCAAVCVFVATVAKSSNDSNTASQDQIPVDQPGETQETRESHDADPLDSRLASVESTASSHRGDIQQLAAASRTLAQSENQPGGNMDDINLPEGLPASDEPGNMATGNFSHSIDPFFGDRRDLWLSDNTADEYFHVSELDLNMALSSPFQFLEAHHPIPPPRTVQPSPGPKAMPDAATAARLDVGDAASTFSSQSGMESMLSPPASMEMDINEFMASVHSFAALTTDVNDFVPPSRHRVSGYLTAYVRYFDPHTPLIHFATFRPARTSPPLTLSILSIGALYAGEQETAMSLYNVSSQLLNAHENNIAPTDLDDCDTVELVWRLQTHVLLAQFAVCHGTNVLHQAGLSHLLKAELMFRSGMRRNIKHHSWDEWIQVESYRRASLWVLVLCATFLADGQATPIPLPNLEEFHLILPSPQDVWVAKSEESWDTNFKKAQEAPLAQLEFYPALSMLLQGTQITAPVSPFGLLLLISGLVIHVVTLERTTTMRLPDLDADVDQAPWVENMEKSLQACERTWKSHPKSATNPLYFNEDPLMSDCIPLLMIAYYHTYAFRRLKLLKASLCETLGNQLPFMQAQLSSTQRQFINPSPPVADLSSDKALHDMLMPRTETQWSTLCRAAKFAAAHLLLRAKAGFKHIARVGPLEMGFHYVVAGFEGAILLAFWMSAAIKQQRSDPDTLFLRSAVREIMEEMDDPTYQRADFAAAPLGALRSMMESGWVWGLQELSSCIRWKLDSSNLQAGGTTGQKSWVDREQE
ncbi:uncharacterized protein PV07_00930 [Cladophialophora immunda]|uniref:Xylanolytic transcriptional activator regulatory domain-containing protein n=1 Tax=Cladophialophora immunda TaxID=569365 RepID=A0A0D2DEL6_9EURO|nr:uncharacterized protein PV07_00930 [Cladophialophora immunda]KIW34134.1 hypothetical protein PV07_00930 [Cladophialophora immunda]